MLEPICVCSQSICYSRRDGIRLRPAPELGLCFVYDPSGPNLYTLNTSAWLVLLLCNGATRDAMVTALHSEVEPLLTRQQAARQVDETLADFVQKRLVTATEAPIQTALMSTQQGG
jgi:Coenzyme PQQ synthesis protein D (PqqD)